MKYKNKKVSQKINLDNLFNLIEEKLIVNGNINKAINRMNPETIVNRGLDIIIDNVFEYTNFINDIKFSDRVNLLLNNIFEIPKCECGELIYKLKIRNGKCLGFNGYCSQSCANRFTNYGKSEEFYKNVAKNIVKTRRLNNSYIPSDNFKNYNKNSENREKTKKILLDKYGVENVGVLGAYSSKSGEAFIRKFIIDNNIDETKCYFKNGGINNREYFQNIFSDELN